jgi:hypothetical protein
MDDLVKDGDNTKEQLIHELDGHHSFPIEIRKKRTENRIRLT